MPLLHPPHRLPVLLAQYAEHWRPGPFDWTSAHCGHWAGGWVLQATGVDALAGLPRLEGARRWLTYLRHCGGLQVVASRQLGVQPVPPAQAQPGDVVLVPGLFGAGALAVCAGRTALALGAHGAPTPVPMDTATAAWPLALVGATAPEAA